MLRAGSTLNVAFGNGSSHVLHVLRHLHPAMHSILVNGEGWGGKTRIGERADGDCHELFLSRHHIEHRCPALGTERECGFGSFVADADELRTSASDLHSVSWEASLSTKDTSGAALTCKAMADRDVDRFCPDSGFQLSAATSSDSVAHGDDPIL